MNKQNSFTVGEDEPTLNSCANCGGDNVYKTTCPAFYIDGLAYFVMCFDCGAAGVEFYDFGFDGDIDSARRHAVRAWNEFGWVVKRIGFLRSWNESQQARDKGQGDL